MRLFVTHFSGSQGLPLKPNWETIIRQLTATSAAATFRSSPVWQYASRFGRETMLTKPISVQLGCSHLIGGHRLVR